MDVTWLAVVMDVDTQKLDEVSATLIEAGVSGIMIEEEEDFHRFLEENRQYWDYVDEELMEKMKGLSRITFYVTDDEDGKAQLNHYTKDIDIPYQTVKLQENDWAYSWQKYYHPIPIGEHLYIVPEWEKDESLPEGKVPVYLNPGLTFGTGSHASTRLCLEAVEAYLEKGETIIDLGCGSGILSVAALVLGAKYATAVDIDPKSRGVVRENAQLNQIGEERLEVIIGDVLTDAPLLAKLQENKVHMVLANIVADVIMPLSVEAIPMLEEDGYFICSGIIDTRAQEVRSHLEEHGYTVIEEKEHKGWMCFVCKKNT